MYSIAPFDFSLTKCEVCKRVRTGLKLVDALGNPHLANGAYFACSECRQRYSLPEYFSEHAKLWRETVQKIGCHSYDNQSC
jgi:hypothetical protein